MIRPTGEYREWLKAAEIASKYPSVMAGLYASLLPPLASVLGSSNFGVEWAGRTATGKSVALGFSASAWGRVDPWSGKRADLPLFNDRKPIHLDNTDAMRSPVAAISVAYEVIDSSRQTVLFSTGATPLADSGGLSSRVITMRDPPFGLETGQTSLDVAAIARTTSRCFGHLGPKFAERVQSGMDSHKTWRDAHAEIDRKFRDAAVAHGGTADRLAGYVASVKLAADLAHGFFPELAWSSGEAIHALWLAAITQGSGRYRQAASDIVAWASRNQHLFWRARKVRPTPEFGWVGRMDGDEPWSAPVYFSRVRLAAILKTLGYDGRSIIDNWNERGWLTRVTAHTAHLGKDAKLRSLVRFNPPTIEPLQFT